MRIQQTLRIASPLLTTLLLTFCAVPAEAQQTVAERAAALKATLEASRIVLRQYQWIETTVISVDGEEKSREQEQCYYGADGKVQKVVLNQSPSGSEPRGPLRRRIAEKKKKEMTEYMKSAVALVKSYVPPSPQKIDLVKEMGQLSLDVLDPGKRARLNLRGYEKPGDNFAMEVDLTNNRPLSGKITTYLDDQSEPITLDVKMGRLNDGTTYPETMTLYSKAKKLTVTVTNSGYRKTGSS